MTDSTETIWRLPRVLAKTGMGRTWTYDAMSRGAFPQLSSLGRGPLAGADPMCWRGSKPANRVTRLSRMSEKQMTRNLRQQEPGRNYSHAEAATNSQLPRNRKRRYAAGTLYLIRPTIGEAFPIVIGGRVQWALVNLMKAGALGCTSICNPAPRLAAYVFSLRDMGLEIETITEPHGGDYPGHHARYVLRSTVTRGYCGGAS